MRADRVGSGRAGGTVAAGVVALVVLAGCSSAPTPVPTPTGLDLAAVDLDDPARNGIEYLDGDRALDAVLRAVRGSSGVTVSGSVVESVDAPDPDGGSATELVDGRTLSLSFEGTARTYRADVTVDGARASVVTADGRSAVSGDPAVTGLAPGDPTSQLDTDGTAGGAACVTPTDPSIARFSPLLSPALLIAALTGADDEALSVSTGALTTLPTAPDRPTVELVVGDASSTVGTLVVSAVGTPWPVSFTAADGSGRGSFTFDGWDEPADVAPPACD
jgi:hypothetical protein